MAHSLPTRATRYAVLGFCAISMSACATTQTHSGQNASKQDYQNAIGVYANPNAGEGLDPIAAAAFWGTRYNRDQSDAQTAVKFSNALRKIGSVDEAVGVMQKTANRFPDDSDVSLEYGKTLIEDGRAFEAVRHIEIAATQNPDNWSVLSAYGVALDQIGEHDAAREKYDRALAMAPSAVSVLNNKGLSYALEGKLTLARQTLRRAVATPGADARIRQNLALVHAIAGDLKDAERLARSDLPPQAADNNIDFFRSMVNQPAYWDEYAATGVDVPAFDQAPATDAPAPLKAPEPRQAPKPEKKTTDEPVALLEVTPVTKASAPSAATPTANVDDDDFEYDSIVNTENAVEGVELKKDD